MSYTVTELITKAFYLSGVSSREFQTVSGDQLGEGLGLLNDVLADKTVENNLIPYYKSANFVTVPGQQGYVIADLIEVDTLTFIKSTVRYSCIKVNRDKYFGSNRAMDITSLPITFHCEREFGGAQIYLYFNPDEAYTMELWGQFRLDSVVNNQDLSLTIDRFYINFLKYQVAERICHEYNYAIPVGVSEQLTKYNYFISKKSGLLDLTQQTITTLGDKPFGMNYGIANLSGGWIP